MFRRILSEDRYVRVHTYAFIRGSLGLLFFSMINKKNFFSDSNYNFFYPNLKLLFQPSLPCSNP